MKMTKILSQDRQLPDQPHPRPLNSDVQQQEFIMTITSTYPM